ncbi:MAG: TIGR03087 family PEP-CTERM/XrtA system glycosyltransferase [Pseudomonadota bacterium]
MNEAPQGEVLFLAHRIPYPPDKGDKIRSWRLLKYLASRFDVHLACFIDNEDDFAHVETVRRLCASAYFAPLKKRRGLVRSAQGLLTRSPLSVRYFNDKAITRAIDTIRARPLLAEIVFSSTMAQYVATPFGDRPRIVDFCDADSAKFTEYAARSKVPMQWIYNREGRLLSADETTVANWADVSFAVSPDEALEFNKRSAIVKIVDWWANGVDTAYFDPHASFEKISEPADIVFTGAMDYRPNAEAADYFVHEIWPQVLAAAPSATFAIVGARPTKKVQALANVKGVQVTGRVDAIQPWIFQAKIAAAPLRIARGVQNKVLEAMAMAKPVVATSAAALGISAHHGEEILVEDGPKEFAQSLVALLKDPEMRLRLGAAARARVVADYQWDAQLSRFAVRLDECLRRSDYSSCASSVPSKS